MNDHAWDGDDYQRRFDELSATGKDMHGEARFVRAFDPTSVLDAGCGTGRVAIELAGHGLDVVGVDVDASMLATARRRGGDAVTWVEADLCGLDLRSTGEQRSSGSGERRRFDVVVMAGNVPLFAEPGTQPALVAALARHVAPGGVLIAGFSTDWADRPYDVDAYDQACTAAGLVAAQRFSTWDRDPWDPSSGYAVSVHRLPA